MSEAETTKPHYDDSNSVQKTGELQSIRASYRLNGKNYLKWSQFVRTYLKGRGRLSHLLTSGPNKKDPKFDSWDEEDSMIMSWLWDSMEPTISDTCMFLDTAKDIWDFISRTYSKANYAAQVYEIKVKTAATKPGNKSVTEYANTLQNLWQELDHYRVFDMKCTEDAAILKKFITKDRIYEFLAGLNPEFDQVRVQVLSKDTSSLEEAISMVRTEESRRSVMLEPQNIKGSALITKQELQKEKGDLPNKPSNYKSQGKDNKDNTYCKKSRHTIEKCWKLNGKPPSKEWGSHGGQQRPQAHMVEKALEPSGVGGLNDEEIHKLKTLLGSLEKPAGPPAASCSLALSERGSGKKIGLAEERNGLYHLEAQDYKKKILPSSFLSSSNKDVVWLHQLRLGHPSFNVLKFMFPQLFQGLDVTEFHCDVCELAKHTRVPFPSSNKSSNPFDLVHSDVWGPSAVPNISGARWFLSLIDDCTRLRGFFYLNRNLM